MRSWPGLHRTAPTGGTHTNNIPPSSQLHVQRQPSHRHTLTHTLSHTPMLDTPIHTQSLPSHTHIQSIDTSANRLASTNPINPSTDTSTHPHIHHTLPSTALSMQIIKAPSSQLLDVSFITLHHHPPPTTSSISSKRAFHSHFLISPLLSSSSPHS